MSVTPLPGRAPRDERLGPWLALSIAVGLLLRAWEASEASLWLDELHTLAHASQPDLSAVQAHVARDNHTPLFFWAVHLFGGWEQGAWLRALPVLTSLLVLLPAIALAARASSAGARAAALSAWLIACLPYQVHFGAMLRPYAWVGLFSAAAVWAAFSARGPSWLRFLLFLLFVLGGLWTHRVMALVVVSIGFARLFARRPGALGLPWLVLAGALAVGPSIPWLVGFAERVTDDRFAFQERVGGYELRPALVKEVLSLPARLFVPYMGILRRPWTQIAYLGAALQLSAVGLVAVAWLTARLRGRTRPLEPLSRGLFLYTLSAFVLISAASLWSWDRVPLHYYTPIAWTLPVLVATLAFALPNARLGRALAAVLVASALLLGVAQAGGHCTEDMRAAVAECRRLGADLRAIGGQDPIYTALLSQPAQVFEQRLPFRAYARDLAALEPGELPRESESGFERPWIVLLRDMRRWRPEWQELAAGRKELSRNVIDDYLEVVVLVPAGG